MIPRQTITDKEMRSERDRFDASDKVICYGYYDFFQGFWSWIMGPYSFWLSIFNEASVMDDFR